MNRLTTVALTALFTSGAASLVLETLWFEWLALHWGRTAEASAVVLAVFMLGLGIGQWLMLHRQRLPLNTAKLWALCEALVGLLALVANWQFANTQAVMGYSAILFILAPTLFMGMTLPLAVACMRQATLTLRLGSVYSVNTAGAALGALATAWWLIPTLGLSATGLLAVAGQGLAALMVWASAQAATEHSLPVNQRHSNAWRPLLAVATSGLFILGMEVIWFRALLLTHRSTTENFAVMLAVVLLGLATGSAAASYLHRRRTASSSAASHSTPSLLAALLLTQSLLTLIPFLLWQPGSQSSVLLHSLWLIALPCACSGALMVTASHALNRNNSRQASAKLILASTLGSAIGAPLIALWLIPAIGVAAALQTLLLSVAIAAFVNRPTIALAGFAAVALMASTLPSQWSQKQQRAAQLYQQLDNATLIAQADGKYQSVQLLESRFLGQALSHRMVTDSYSMTSTAADSERYMRLFGWLPAAMQPALKNSLLISYGLGTTAETLLANPSIQSLTIADPSAAVLNASRLIQRHQQPLDDPRVHIRLEDGRKILQNSPAAFDLITGEPPPPRLAGMHALYSQEYFQLMHRALSKGGWASYWLPVDQLSLSSSQAIIKAFCNAFADCSLWAGSHYNWILLGSHNGKISPQGIHTLFSKNADLLKQSGLEHPAQLASTFIAGPATLTQWAKPTAALKDNWPQRIEAKWPSQQTIQQYANWMDDRHTEHRYAQSPYHSTWDINNAELQLAWSLQSLMNGQFQPDNSGRLALVAQFLPLTQWQTPVLWALGTDHHKVAIAQNQNSDIAALHQAVGLLAQRRYGAAEKQFEALASQPNNPFPLAHDLAGIAANHSSP